MHHLALFSNSIVLDLCYKQTQLLEGKTISSTGISGCAGRHFVHSDSWSEVSSLHPVRALLRASISCLGHAYG